MLGGESLGPAFLEVDLGTQGFPGSPFTGEFKTEEGEFKAQGREKQQVAQMVSYQRSPKQRSLGGRGGRGPGSLSSPRQLSLK